jgi:diguanylate cyclase (GGDEF)-like protein/PAS domain S-box-containing protein
MYRVLSCLTVEHDWRLLSIAGVLCFLASLAAIHLFYRAQAATGRARALWIGIAGVAAGCGIWATHFIAMLAYEPGVAVAYDMGLTVLSLLAAIVVTSLGLGLAASGSAQWRAPVGGAIVGGGVACMHYLGMSALQLPGRVGWSLDLVAASIVLGIVLGALALTAAKRREGMAATLTAALCFALAILSHHFTAMGAVEITPDPARVIDALTLAPATLALVIGSVTAVMLAISLAGSVVDERFHAQSMRLETALNNMHHGLMMFDAASKLVLVNQHYLEMYRLSRDALKPGCTLREILHLRKANGTFKGDPDQYIAKCVDESGLFRGDPDIATFVRKGVENKLVEIPDGRTISITNRSMAGNGWVSSHTDITESTRAAKELHRTKTFLDTVIENVPATIVVKDAKDQRYVLINRAGEKLFGLPREQMIGKSSYDFFSKEDADFITARDTEVLASGRQVFAENTPVQTPDGSKRVLTTTRVAIRDANGEPQYLLGVLEDVTERRLAEQRIAHLAHHDPLTDLPNRAAFTECLEETLARVSEVKDGVAVLCMNLDRFKATNDLFGHSVGDALLKQFAYRLQKAAEGAFLARVGGDEFTVISAGGPQPASAEALAERVLEAMCQEFEIEGHQLRIGLSIGVAIFPTDGMDATALIANADAALSRAKSEGRGMVRFFEADMDKRLRERRALQHDLEGAVARGELMLHYQPQATIDGTIVGFEALARWRHPTRGMVPPGVFIPLAEESGLIVPIGEWILREVCNEAASWPRPLQIAVNLSPVQFRHGGLPNLVHTVLLETGLKPGRLELEITEGVLIDDFSRAVSILHRLKALGVRIAMDDFGTGYSSLSYLQSFPFDKIKIDQGFISNLNSSPQAVAIVRAVIAMGRGLNLPVIAEGVESEEQLAFLAREACDEVQGYLIGKPLPIEHYGDAIGRPTVAAPRTLRLVS